MGQTRPIFPLFLTLFHSNNNNNSNQGLHNGTRSRNHGAMGASIVEPFWDTQLWFILTTYSTAQTSLCCKFGSKVSSLISYVGSLDKFAIEKRLAKRVSILLYKWIVREPLWWSRGQHSHLLFQWSEFKSLRSLQFFL